MRKRRSVIKDRLTGIPHKKIIYGPTHGLPAGLTVSRVDDATPRDVLAQVAEISFACGVLPVPGAITRGGVVPGLCLVAKDASGRVVSTASSYRHRHPDSPRAGIAHWGMLATREAWRGRKIGLILGAVAIAEMWERFGARGFMTGIRADNAASQALCNKLGVRATDWVYAQCIDAAVLGGTSLTKQAACRHPTAWRSAADPAS